MKTYVAYACFTETSVVVSYNVADVDHDTIMTVLNAIDTKSAELDDGDLRKFVNNRQQSYRFCEGLNWQSLSGIGNTKEAALNELRNSIHEWVSQWVENYYEVGSAVIEYLDLHEPNSYTDITAHLKLVRL